MKSDFPEWQKLVKAARAYQDPRDTAAPLGFSTRVAARARLGEPPTVSVLFVRWSMRALLVAGALSVIAAAANLRPVLNAIDEETVALTDPVADQADLSSS